MKAPDRPQILLGSAPLLAMTFILAACSGDADKADADKDDAAAIPVETSLAARGEASATYSGTAALEAYQEAAVVAKVSGEVTEILVEEGESVNQGQILARLDGDRLRLELAQAKANLAKLERDYNRNIELHEKGLVAAGAFENIKYEVDAVRAQRDLAQLQYAYTTIRAPISGVVSARHIKVGNTIEINSPTFHITDLDPLVAYLHVAEKEFGKIRPDQPAFLIADALPGQTYAAVVARISPVVDSSTGTFKVSLEIPDSTGDAAAALKPGMFGRFSIVYDTRPDTLLIPRAAIIESEAGDSVYVVADNIATRRIVSTGFTQGAQIEVTDGLNDGEAVVIIGQSTLKDSTKVHVIGSENKAANKVADAGSDTLSGS